MLKILQENKKFQGLRWVRNRILGAGTLPQAPFFGEKTSFWRWNVAAGAFFYKEIRNRL